MHGHNFAKRTSRLTVHYPSRPYSVSLSHANAVLVAPRLLQLANSIWEIPFSGSVHNVLSMFYSDGFYCSMEKNLDYESFSFVVQRCQLFPGVFLNGGA